MCDTVTHPTLHVSLPLLASGVPRGWTVNLVDTPGLGEANETIQQLAEHSVQLSAAYIYLLQTENVGSKLVNETFKTLADKDQGMQTRSRRECSNESPFRSLTRIYYTSIHLFRVRPGMASKWVWS